MDTVVVAVVVMRITVDTQLEAVVMSKVMVVVVMQVEVVVMEVEAVATAVSGWGKSIYIIV